MKLTVIGSTKPSYVATAEELQEFGGHAAGVCYMRGTFADLLGEASEATQKRIKQTKVGGHHSVYGHTSINLYLDEIPKALAMVLNNEKEYTTSEKSARYTKMVLSEKEQELYNKWLERFKNLLTNRYGEKYPKFFTPSRVEKLAQENARYLTSVMTPTSMIYSTSLRQLNYLYAFMIRELNNPNKNQFYQKLAPSMMEFCNLLEKSGYIDPQLCEDGKNRKLSLIMENPKGFVKHFGTVFSAHYKASLATVAQMQRHRSISYQISLGDKAEYYVPEILTKDAPELVDEWLSDISSLGDNIPQGRLVDVYSTGTLDNVTLMAKERACTFAQLEVNNVTRQLIKDYVEGLKQSNHPRAEELEQYTKGSRCTYPDYTCSGPCGIKEGITGIDRLF